MNKKSKIIQDLQRPQTPDSSSYAQIKNSSKAKGSTKLASIEDQKFKKR